MITLRSKSVRTAYEKFSYLVIRHIATTTLCLKGHSKWQNIAGDKSKTDFAKNLKIDSYLRRIKSIAKDGGFDINVNSKLLALRKQFKVDCLPTDTFDSYLLKLKNNRDVTIFYNFVGPDESLFIVQFEAETKSRILKDVNRYLKNFPNFRLTKNLAETHFHEKGVILVKGKTKESMAVKFEQLEEVGIELECEEIQHSSGDQNEDGFELVCSKTSVNKIEAELDKRGYQITLAEVQMRPLERISLTKEDTDKVALFYKELKENESVKNVYDNIE